MQVSQRGGQRTEAEGEAVFVTIQFYMNLAQSHGIDGAILDTARLVE